MPSSSAEHEQGGVAAEHEQGGVAAEHEKGGAGASLSRLIDNLS